MNITMKKDDEKNYFVCYLDIMGFKENVIHHKLSTIHNSLDKVLYYLPVPRPILPSERSNLGQKNEENKYHIYYKPYRGDIELEYEVGRYIYEIKTNYFFNFSDSIFFYIEDKDDDDEDRFLRLKAMCWLANTYICKSLLVSDGVIPENPDVIPLGFCGAIAYGKAIMDMGKKIDIANMGRKIYLELDLGKNIHIGPPIIDAVELTNAQEWVGAVLHKSIYASEKFKSILPKLLGHNNQIFEYDKLPLKQEKCVMKDGECRIKKNRM